MSTLHMIILNIPIHFTQVSKFITHNPFVPSPHFFGLFSLPPHVIEETKEKMRVFEKMMVVCQSLLGVFGGEAIILVCTPDATSRCFVTFQTFRRERREGGC